MTDYEMRRSIHDAALETWGAAPAAALMEVLDRVPSSPPLTRSDLDLATSQLRADFAELRGDFGELRGDFATLRGEFSELRGEFAELRGSVGEELGALRSEIAQQTKTMLFSLTGLFVGVGAVVLGAAQLAG